RLFELARALLNPVFERVGQLREGAAQLADLVNPVPTVDARLSGSRAGDVASEVKHRPREPAGHDEAERDADGGHEQRREQEEPGALARAFVEVLPAPRVHESRAGATDRRPREDQPLTAEMDDLRVGPPVAEAPPRGAPRLGFERGIALREEHVPLRPEEDELMRERPAAAHRLIEEVSAREHDLTPQHAFELAVLIMHG